MANLSLAEKLRIIAVMARTLHEVHDRGILHLDVKPSNILIDGRGEPFLADFGFSSLFSRDVTGQFPADFLALMPSPLSNRAGGTWEYMAPEQFDNPPAHLFPATDLYSLGVSMFELVTGRRPFTSEAEDLQLRRLELRNLHQESGFPDISAIDLDFAERREVIKIMRKALAPIPERRFASGNEFANAVNQLVERVSKALV